MRKYQDSDYAVNKFSQGIVYRFADGAIEITLEDFLRENPQKTLADFIELKSLSDNIYHEQDLKDTQYRKRARSLENSELLEQYLIESPETILIHQHNLGQALYASEQLLKSKALTEIQKRRFLYYLQGYSTRKIAKMEGVSQSAVWDSLFWTTKKLKKFLKE